MRGIKTAHGVHIDAAQGVFGQLVAIGVAAVHRGVKARPAMVAGLVLASLMLALRRSASRCHSGAGKAGAASCRAASAAALANRSG